MKTEELSYRLDREKGYGDYCPVCNSFMRDSSCMRCNYPREAIDIDGDPIIPSL